MQVFFVFLGFFVFKSFFCFSFLHWLATSEERYSNTSRKWQRHFGQKILSDRESSFLVKIKLIQHEFLVLQTRTWYSIRNTRSQRSSGNGCMCFVTEIYTTLLRKCSFYKGFFQKYLKRCSGSVDTIAPIQRKCLLLQQTHQDFEGENSLAFLVLKKSKSFVKFKRKSK